MTDVVDALGLQHTSSATWEDGIEVAYAFDIAKPRLFVSPQVEDWVFVVGPHALPDPAAGAEAAITTLSAKLHTEVQYFVSHRVVELHGWMVAIDAKLTRAYAYLGEANRVLVQRGKMTAAERELSQRKNRRPTEAVVFAVASRWSIDPQTLDDRPAANSGTTGTFTVPPQSRAKR